jgi:hypothetical protein
MSKEYYTSKTPVNTKFLNAAEKEKPPTGLVEGGVCQ